MAEGGVVMSEMMVVMNTLEWTMEKVVKVMLGAVVEMVVQATPKKRWGEWQEWDLSDSDGGHKGCVRGDDVCVVWDDCSTLFRVMVS